MLCSAAWLTYRTEIVLEDPIRNAKTLRPGNAVHVAIVDTHVYTRVDDLILGLREAGEEACLLCGVRVSCCHLKIQDIAPEEKSQHVANSATGGRMTGRVFGEIGSVDEWLPIRIEFGLSITVLIAEPDCCDGSPKVVKVLALPAGDLCIGKRSLSQRIHVSRISNVIQVV